MIKVRLQIGEGDILDTYKAYGFIYMDADERTEAPIKSREVTSYAEEAGEHMDPRTVQDAFDYTAKFLIECPNTDLENANIKIKAFNQALYTQESGSDIRTYKQVTFYNDFNRVKIVGYPEPITQPTEFYRRQDGSVMDCAVVELKIRVTDPSLCDFSTTGNDITISLRTDGTHIYVDTSRPLAEDEYPLLLRRGVVKRDDGYVTVRGKHRWQAYYQYFDHVYANNTNIVYSPFILGNGGRLELSQRMLEVSTSYFRVEDIWRWGIRGKAKHMAASIRKSQHSRFILPALAGKSGRICYGIAIYKDTPGRNTAYGENKRVSNVAYFRSNMRMLRDANDYDDADALEQWISV